MEGKHGKGVSRGEIDNSQRISFNEAPKKFKNMLFGILTLIPVIQLFTPLNNDIWFILKYGETICAQGIPLICFQESLYFDQVSNHPRK